MGRTSTCTEPSTIGLTKSANGSLADRIGLVDLKVTKVTLKESDLTRAGLLMETRGGRRARSNARDDRRDRNARRHARNRARTDPPRVSWRQILSIGRLGV